MQATAKLQVCAAGKVNTKPADEEAEPPPIMLAAAE